MKNFSTFLKEDNCEGNYMLLPKLQALKTQLEDLLKMQTEIEASEPWIADHITTACDDLYEVHNYLTRILKNRETK